MKKKLLATLMIVAMSASMLAGCGSKADAPADNAAATDDAAKDDAAKGIFLGYNGVCQGF